MFDPYHRWLGIPPEHRPPTYYQLLGLAPGESNLDVIEDAAVRQMAHVRTYQSGPQGSFATKVLNELSQARGVLLNPAKKQAYDASLSTSGKVATQARKPNRLTSDDDDRPVSRKGKRSIQSKPPWLWISFGAGGLGLGILAVIIALSSGGPPLPKPGELPPVVIAAKPPEKPLEKKLEFKPEPPQPPFVKLPEPKPRPPEPVKGKLDDKEAKINLHRQAANNARMSADGTRLLITPDSSFRGLPQELILLDLTNGQEIRRFPLPVLRPKDSIHRAFLGLGGKRVYAPHLGPEILVYDAETAQPLPPLVNPDLGQDVYNMGMYFSPDDKQALVATNSKNFHLWDLEASKILWRWDNDDSSSCSGTFLDDGKRILVRNSFGQVFLVDRESGKTIKNLVINREPSDYLAVYSWTKPHQFLTLGIKSGARLFDADTGQIVEKFPFQHQLYSSVLFTNDRKFALNPVPKDETLVVWDFDKNAKLGSFALPFVNLASRGYSYLLTPDDRYLIVAGQAGVWRFDWRKAIEQK